ncbi:MAG: diaminopimelate epimerase, partial [Nitriliruptoraceae bacterium]
MQFTKAHGTGNDFVVFADLDDQLEISPAIVQAVTDRRFGIGADGVIRIGRSQAADVFMDYRNADGSIVEMCGNGIRVVAKYVLDRKLVSGETTVAVETRAGVKRVNATLAADGTVDEVTVDMGSAVFDPGE